MGRTRTKEPQTEEKLRSAPVLVPNTLLPVAACVSLTAGTDDIAAEIAAHRAEIVRHEETIEHGDAHTPEPPAEEHKKMGHTHAAAGQNHDRLLNAISDLEKFL
jgi:hypothetical protein